MKYLEGNTYKIDGVDKIYQPDGTFRDASIAAPPKPADYVEVPVDNTEADAAAKIKAEDYTSAKNPQGLTVAEMVAKGNQGAQASPVNTAGVTYKDDGTRTLSAAEQEIADYYATLKPKTAEEIAADEEKVRTEKLANQKIAIDSINSMYDNLLAQINKDNKSREGSTANINALSGNRGSASGAANDEATRVANEKVVKANENERNAKIAQVQSDYKNQIDSQLLKERELRTNDANEYIKYKSGELDRNKQNAADLRKSYIAAGLKPEDLTDKEYEQIAKDSGYTIEQVKAIYKSEYETNVNSAVAAEEERVAKLEKTKSETELNKANANAKSDENLLVNKGYVYVSTPAQRDALIAQGRIVTEKNGKTYVAPSTLKTKVITRGGNQILIDTTTGEDIKDLGPKPEGAGSSDKNYTATTIPGELKKEILQNIKAGATIDEVMATYSEVSTSYLQSLYASPSQFNFNIGGN